jgi:hypothetical protein
MAPKEGEAKAEKDEQKKKLSTIKKELKTTRKFAGTETLKMNNYPGRNFLVHRVSAEKIKPNPGRVPKLSLFQTHCFICNYISPYMQNYLNVSKCTTSSNPDNDVHLLR